jgi:hypothetical protein
MKPFTYQNSSSWGWCLTPVIPVTQEAETGELRGKTSPGKKVKSPHLNKQARSGGSHLYSQLLRRQKWQDLRLKPALAMLAKTLSEKQTKKTWRGGSGVDQEFY